MAWKRLVVLIAAALCATCGTLTVHGQDIRQSDLLATIEGLGVCGPVHRAVLDLAPRTADGSFDTGHMTYEVDSPEISNLFMHISAPERFAIADQVPAAVRVFEISGKVQGLAFYWPILDADELGVDDLAVVEATAAALSPFLGEPKTDDTGQQEWSTESLTIRAWQPSEDSKVTRLLVGCTATEETYLAALESAEPTDMAEDVTEASDEDGLPPNPWLDRNLVEVLFELRVPGRGPRHAGRQRRRPPLHQGDGAGDVPTEWWWWFIDGKAVYAAGDFLPPKGSKRARSSYEGFRSRSAASSASRPTTAAIRRPAPNASSTKPVRNLHHHLPRSRRPPLVPGRGLRHDANGRPAGRAPP